MKSRIPPAQRSPYPGGDVVVDDHTPGTDKHAPQQARAPPPDRFLRLAEVSARTSLSRSEIYKRINLGEFPKPLKLYPGQTGRVVWVERDITGWMQERVQEWRARMPA